MTYSYTQISQYLTCPRRYRHRYLDGWQEKDVRAAMLFGRCFEQALAALFRHEDPAVALFEQWAPCKNLELLYSGHDTWDHMLRQGPVTALSPSSMRSENWTAHLVFWSGRPAPPVIPRSLTASRPWIRSWFATPG
jgi:hypothetical protein